MNGFNFITTKTLQIMDTTMDKRLSKQEVQELYGVNRKTIEHWVKHYDFPMIQISPYKRFVREKDLIEWERKHEIQQ